MLLPFHLGLGGRVGDGKQWWSWIHVDDLVSAVHHILSDSRDRGNPASSPVLTGPVNMTAPNPVTNAEFTRVLAHQLKRPARLPVPAFALRLVFGELADEGLLASTRVLPKKLIESGFEFKYPELADALNDLL
jgi:hypothetical protein